MLPSMMSRNPTRTAFKKDHLIWKLALLIVIKITVLMGIWYWLVKDHKVQGHTEAIAHYFLTPNASPQKQLIPRSPWD